MTTAAIANLPAWRFTEERIGFPGVTFVSDTPRVILGTRAQANHPVHGGGEFIYLQGVAGTTARSWVIYEPDNYNTILLTTGQIGQVAIAMAPILANQFGWYQISGKAFGLTLPGFADNAMPYASSTAGSVTQSVTAGSRIKLARGASNHSIEGFTEFEIQFPFMDAGTAA